MMVAVTHHRLTALTRHTERGRSERAALDALLDAVPVGVLSTVVDGEPWSVPMLVARDGDRVLLHGSTGAGALRHAAAGAPVTLTVFALDGIVVAYNAFHSSANYRSAVLRGRLSLVTGEDATAALGLLTDSILPGRTAEVPATTRREQAATTVLSLAIEDGSWLLKQRTGGSSAPDSGTTEGWTGVVPLRLVAGPPEQDDWNSSEDGLPASVRAVLDDYR